MREVKAAKVKKQIPVVRYAALALLVLGMAVVFMLISLGGYRILDGFDAAGPVWNGVIAVLEILTGVLGLWFWRKPEWRARLLVAACALVAAAALFLAIGPDVAKWSAGAGLAAAAVYIAGIAGRMKK
jgi:hypothetical protein